MRRRDFLSCTAAIAAAGCSKSSSAAQPQTGALEVIHSRTSIRKFNGEKDVPDELVDKLLKAAMCAPSAMNAQPWEFIVVRDKAVLKALADGLPSSRIANGASLAIVVCGNLNNGLKAPRAREYWIQDCSAATQNLLLAAKSLGLGAVWTGVYPMEPRVAHVRKVLAIPDGYMPLNAIPIGWPAENPPPKNKWKPERVHHDKW